MTRYRPSARWLGALSLTTALIGTAVPGPAMAAAVKLHVSCYTNPETVTIRNNTGQAITILKVGSTYQPREFEPFTVNKQLNAGASITYQTGSLASTKILSHEFIFANGASLDKVRVKTSIGTFKRAC